ncbi:MAG: hypothetical protein ACR2PR_02340 [Pseudohongiellaceae bacterium]
MKRLLVTLLLASYATVSSAAEYVCRYGGATRNISVEYEQPGEPVPCRVRYEKAEGVEYPWFARGQVGFCEDRMAYLATRLEGFGWTCTLMEDPEAATTEESEDDPDN